jgi:membrane protein DedA with SNARE-associated domain
VDELITSLQTLPPLVIYSVVFTVALVENVFPPSPSDVLIVCAGSLTGIGHVGFLEILLAATCGSTLGFLLMYGIGIWFGRRILDGGRLKFLPREAIRKVETWFVRYGYWIIVGNRFLAGTRAVVAFFAGVSELHLPKTFLLSFVSALLWNTILISSGYALGNNWQQIGSYLASYGQIVTGAIALIVLLIVGRSLVMKYRKPQP